MIRFAQLEQLGVSIAAFSEAADGDCARDLTARRRVCETCGIEVDNLAWVQQVHGTRIVPVREPHRGQGTCQARADGLITNIPGVPLALFVADCVPLYLADPQRKAIGLIHAGRRGTFGNMAGLAVEAMRSEFGCLAYDLYALIGPSAGPTCYEVSEEIAKAWRRAGLPVQGRHLDLWEANKQQLVEAGLLIEHVFTSGLCTISDTRFFSHRRRPDGKRHMALLMI